jgi:single-strand DNA-binding protein
MFRVRRKWHPIVAVGQLVDTRDNSLCQGRQVYVEGRLTTRRCEAKDGSGKRYWTEIVAWQLRVLGNGSNTQDRKIRRHPF